MSFPIQMDKPAEHVGALPAETGVVVIGGGVIGVSAALVLAQRGMPVVLLEKGRIAGEQSSRNWGWIRVQGRDLAEIPIAQEAQTLWQDWARKCDTDIGLRQTGTLYLADSADDVANFQAWLDDARPFGLSSRMLSSDEVAQQVPHARTRWPGGLYTPTDWRAEPFVAVPALARLAARQGAVIREGCAVRGLDREAGRVTGVVTEAGRIACEAVILAGGAWSRLFLKRHGASIPQLSVRATAAATDALPEIYSGGAGDGRLAWRRREDEGYTIAAGGFHELFIGPDAIRSLPRYLRQFLRERNNTRLISRAPKHYPDAWGTPRRWRDDEESPFERMRLLNPAPHHNKVRHVTRFFEETFPEIAPVSIRRAWAGMIDVMPDVVPLVDQPEALSGLTICTGMSGHGFGIGPGFGRIAADLATGGAVGHDLSRFRLSRFSDGSKLQPGPSL